jgi:alkylation response protein AidB-like acyl-CoA dehydrogenase
MPAASRLATRSLVVTQDLIDMQRSWRDVRLYRIGPISNEMARNFIGHSLGLPRSY